MTTLIALAISGCGRAMPETAPVEGRVTLVGKPLTTGAIMFFPTEGRPATGAIGPDGAFKLTTFVTDDGALIGKHTVTIEASQVTGAEVPRSFEEEIQKGGQKAGEIRAIVPRKYADRATSGLTAEVKAQPEPNRINFDLSN